MFLSNRFSWLLNLFIIRCLCAFSLLHLWNMLTCFFSIFYLNCNHFPFSGGTIAPHHLRVMDQFTLKCSREDFWQNFLLIFLTVCLLSSPPPWLLNHPLTHRPPCLAVHLSVAGSCGWAGLGCHWNIPEEKSPQ